MSSQGRGIGVGAPANIALIDPAVRRIVDPSAQWTRSTNTPYRGMELPGQVLYTFHQGASTVVEGAPVAKEDR